MGTGYTVGGDTWYNTYWQNPGGQTFRVPEAVILHYIKLYVYKPNEHEGITVKIKFANGDHEPFGDVLAGANIAWNDLPPDVNQGWVTKELHPPLSAIPGEYFCILLEAGTPWMNQSKWVYDAGDATYPYGLRIHSDDFGQHWTKHYFDDHLFFIWGTPPAPPPPPQPPPDRWAPLGIQQDIIPGGFTIVLTSDTPSHAYLHWTEETPLTHRTATIQRGLSVPWDSYWCFVAWHTIEQEEEGDTLAHTFIWTEWDHCDIKHFRFSATIGSGTSPSGSPIFTKHYDVADLPYFMYYPLEDPRNAAYNTSWVAHSFLSLKPGTPTKAYIWLFSIGSRPFDMDVYIEECVDQPPAQTQPYADMTGHVLASGVIPQAELNSYIRDFHLFEVNLVSEKDLELHKWYCLTTCDNDATKAFRYHAFSEIDCNNYPIFTTDDLPSKPIRNWTIQGNVPAFASKIT